MSKSSKKSSYAHDVFANFLIQNYIVELSIKIRLISGIYLANSYGKTEF